MLMHVKRNVDFFDDSDLASCALTSRIVERARYLRGLKYRSQRSRALR